MGDLVLHGEEYAAQVGVVDAVPFLGAVLMERLFDGDAGIVEGDIESAERLHSAVDEGPDLTFDEYVGLEVERLAALGLDLPFDLLPQCSTPSTERHLAAFDGEGKCCGAADAGSGAGDRHDLTREAAPSGRRWERGSLGRKGHGHA